MGSSTLLRALGVAHVLVAIMLLPANLFLGFLTIVIVLPAQIWLFCLGVWLWQPDARIQTALRITHLVLGPFALLLIVYGVYAVLAATHSAAAGGGLLGSFGLIPITLGVCSGLLSLWSLYVANNTWLAIPEGPGRTPDPGRHSMQRGETSNGIGRRKNPAAYVEAFVTAVRDENKDSYITHARAAAVIFKEHGALNVVECWGDDISDQDVSTFPMAVKCRTEETLVLSWIIWPSKEARNTGMKKVIADPRLSPENNPLSFAGQRMIYGGFKMIVEE